MKRFVILFIKSRKHIKRMKECRYTVIPTQWDKNIFKVRKITLEQRTDVRHFADFEQVFAQ